MAAIMFDESANGTIFVVVFLFTILLSVFPRGILRFFARRQMEERGMVSLLRPIVGTVFFLGVAIGAREAFKDFPNSIGFIIGKGFFILIPVCCIVAIWAGEKR